MANVPIHSMTDLWNSGGTTYYGIKMDVTNSASAAGSKLFAMQIASVNIFDVDKSGDVTLTSVDAGATAGPILNLSRISASPAASDLIGSINFNGEDSAGNTDTYAKIFSTITDPTSTSEDASLTFQNVVAGTLTTQAVITATGWNSMNIGATTPGSGAFTTLSTTGAVSFTSTDAGAGNGPIVALYRNSASPAASDLLGRLSFTGNDSGGNETTYVDMYARIDDATNGSEDSTLFIRNIVSGTNTIQALVTATGWNSMNIGATTAGTGRFTTLDATGAVSFTTALTVANGGTGVATHTAGLLVGNGTSALISRVLTGTANEITVTNGSGVSGNPTLSLPSAMTMTGKTLTGGTYAGAAFNGTVGATTPSAGDFTALTATSAVFTNTVAGNFVLKSGAVGGGPNPVMFRDSANSIMGYLGFVSASNTLHIWNALGQVNVLASGGTVATFTSTGLNAASIGATTPDTGAFTTLSANSTVTFTNGGSMTGTWSNLGTVTTVDINGGTIDGATVGASSASTGAFTTLSSSGTATLATKTTASTAGLFVNATAAINPTAATVGASFVASGQSVISCTDGSSPLTVKRDALGGPLVTFYASTTSVASINESGGTVTYGAFAGAHPTQMNRKPKELLRGTVMQSIDEICDWGPSDFKEILPKVRVSNDAGSKAVYGVFSHNDNDGTRDFNIVSLGAYVIRIAPGIEVQIGDYLESNGDGCARVQADDVFRSSTVGKVTATVPIDQYEDGSYTVPCTLHCG